MPRFWGMFYFYLLVDMVFLGVYFMYEWLNDFMIDDPYFCLCGCSPWYWNLYRFLFKRFTSKE